VLPLLPPLPPLPLVPPLLLLMPPLPLVSPPIWSDAQPAIAAMHSAAIHLLCVVLFIFPSRGLIKMASHSVQRGTILICS
jgi:hypothetical protein